MLSSLLGWAVAAPLVSSEVVSEGSLKRRLADDDAELALLLASEQGGIAGPCVCTLEPLGGLDRIATVARAMRRRQPDTPVISLDVGGLLSPVARDRDAGMAAAGGVFDVLNATSWDWPGLVSLPGLPWVSASHRGEGVPPVRILTAGAYTVAVTGVGSRSHVGSEPAELQVLDPVEALARLVPTLKADLVVVMAFDVGDRLPQILALPGIDVVVEGGGFRARYGPFHDADTVWVRSWQETPVLGELRLWVAEDAPGVPIERAHFRWVRLDERTDP